MKAVKEFKKSAYDYLIKTRSHDRVIEILSSEKELKTYYDVLDDELAYYEITLKDLFKGENTMRKLKLEVYNNTTENIVERFEITEFKQAVKLATDQAYSEREHYTIELLGEIDNGYDTLGTYELDEVDELQSELERLGEQQ